MLLLYYFTRKLQLNFKEIKSNTSVNGSYHHSRRMFKYLPINDIDFTSARAKKGNLIMSWVLSLVPKDFPSYVSKRLLGTFPQTLPLLHKPSYLDLEYHELLKACTSVKVEVTEEMAIAVEKGTRLQTNSKLWFKFRAG